MKIVGHILILFVLCCSLKAFGEQRLIDQLGSGPIEVVIDQERGAISVNSHKIDGSFLIEKKDFTKGGALHKHRVSFVVIGDKIVIDISEVRGITLMSGNILKVSELFDYIVSGGATISDGPTGTHGGGK